MLEVGRAFAGMCPRLRAQAEEADEIFKARPGVQVVPASFGIGSTNRFGAVRWGAPAEDECVCVCVDGGGHETHTITPA